MYLSMTYPVPSTSETRVTGRPIRRNIRNPIGCPARADMPAAATLAAAAIRVALPPKQAPMASAHQYASSPPLPACSSSTTGSSPR
jgi:hypothetical protein